LFAHRLAFEHPVTRVQMVLELPMPITEPWKAFR